MNDLKHIEFNGKCFDTKFYREISDREFNDIRNEHYKKPDFNDVAQQIKKCRIWEKYNGDDFEVLFPGPHGENTQKKVKVFCRGGFQLKRTCRVFIWEGAVKPKSL